MGGSENVCRAKCPLPLRKPPASDDSIAGGGAVQVLAAASGFGMEELRRILAHSRWTLREAATLAAARTLLAEQPAVVLICEALLPDGNWKHLLDYALQLPLSPPLIVVARQADDYLWMEVLNRGGYNLLAIPLDERELFRVVSMAWLNLRDRSQRSQSAAAFRKTSSA